MQTSLNRRLVFALVLLVIGSTIPLYAGDPKPVSLFDGKTLTGWTQENGKPITKGWEAKDGALYQAKKGGSIYSQKEYENFDLRFEWKIGANGNSGVKYLINRYDKKVLGYEYQLIDDTGRGIKPTNDNSTGALYALYSPPADKILKPAGEWNTARIVKRGTKIEHWLNGKKIIEADSSTEDFRERVNKSKFKSAKGFADAYKGRLMLQDHGSEVWFKNITIIEYPSTAKPNPERTTATDS